MAYAYPQLQGTGHPLAKYPGPVGRQQGGYNPHQQGSQGSQFWQQQQQAIQRMRQPGGGGWGARPPGTGGWGPEGDQRRQIFNPGGGGGQGGGPRQPPGNAAWYQGPRQPGMVYAAGHGQGQQVPSGLGGGYTNPLFSMLQSSSSRRY